MEKYQRELERLLRKHGRIIGLLYILDADIAVRRDLERDNDVTFQLRPSIRVEETRGKLQNELANVKRDIFGIIQIMIKQAKNE